MFHNRTIRLLLLSFLCLQLSASAGVPGKKETWAFGNFGEGASGNISYVKDKMVVSTQNTIHCFFDSDSYSYAFKKQAFPYDDCSRSAVSVSIDSFASGSAGIMMRTSTGLGAANVHLEVTSTGDLMLFYRKSDGDITLYSRVGKLPFPVSIRLVRQGNIFTAFYKNERQVWEKGGFASAFLGTEALIGFYACAGAKSQIGYTEEMNGPMQVNFYNREVAYQQNYTAPEQNFTDKMPVKKGTLLRDNFNDGSLSNKPETKINPVWSGITFGNLPRSEGGGRFWRKNGDGSYYLGSKKWADYSLSVDLKFNVQKEGTNELTLQLRYQSIAVYDKMARYYALAFRGGNKVFFEKYESGTLVFSKPLAITNYIDSKQHALKVSFLDRNYEVFWDGKKLLEGSDTLNPITYGNIAFAFSGASVDIDNLEVLEVDDPVNGSKDNLLQNYYDTPIPAYLKKYGY